MHYILHCQWPNEVYLFLPINLISELINKFIEDRVTYSVILTPAWPGLSAIPNIISLLFDDPIFIPSLCLEGQLPTRHPFNLIAWPISTLPAEAKAYPKMHQQPCCTVLPPPHSPHINDTGNSFIHMLIRKGICVKLLFQ